MERTRGIGVHTVVALGEQISRAYKNGKLGKEMVDTFRLVTGFDPRDRDGDLLRSIDALGLTGEAAKDKLKRCGAKLYNMFRAVEPTDIDLLHLRLFAIRCLEAGIGRTGSSRNNANVMLCYVRTGLKLLELVKSGEIAPEENERKALECFRRGFALNSLDHALRMFYAQQESQEAEDFAASAFAGTVQMTRLEVDMMMTQVDKSSSTSDARPDFLCSLWCGAAETLKSVAQLQYKGAAKSCMRKLAVAFYSRKNSDADLANALKLFGAMERAFGAVEEPEDINDLLMVADMQVSLGDRVLAENTLDKAESLRDDEDFNGKIARDGKLTLLTWDQVMELESKDASMEEDEEQRNDTTNATRSFYFIVDMKKALVRLKLALAEVNAMKNTKTLEEPEYDQALRVCYMAFEQILQVAHNLLTFEEKARAELVGFMTRAMSISCFEICNELGFSEENIQQTYLEAEKLYKSLKVNGSTMRVEILKHLNPMNPIVGSILEGIDSRNDLLPMDRRILLGVAWKRLREQEQHEDEIDGAITTASFLLEFIQDDDSLLGHIHASLARNIFAKVDLAHDDQARQYLLEKTIAHGKQALALLSKGSLGVQTVLYQSLVLTGKFTEAASMLVEMLRNRKLATWKLCTLLVPALKHGLLDASIDVLQRIVNESCDKRKIWTHHLVTLKLTRMGISPTDLIYDGQLNLSDENAQTISEDSEHMQSILQDIDDFVCMKSSTSSANEDNQVCKAWLQVCCWNLAKHTKGNMKLQGKLYWLCSRLLEAKSERLFAAKVLATACLVDYIVAEVMDSSQSMTTEPGIPVAVSKASRMNTDDLDHSKSAVDEETIAVLGSCCKQGEGEGQLQSQSDHFIFDLGKFVYGVLKEETIGRLDTFLHKLPSGKLAQLGLFCAGLGAVRASQEILAQTLQNELKQVSPNDELVGKVLVLLVKQSRSDDEAIPWVQQALQLLQMNTDFTSHVRDYFGTWAWNHGVKLGRDEHGETSIAWLRQGIDFHKLGYSPKSKKTTQQSQEKVTQMEELLQEILKTYSK